MCDLYSPRLQTYFTDACRTNDLSTFRQKIQARNNKMQELDIQLARMKQEFQQLKMQENMHMNQMRIAQSQARMASTQWTVSGWIGPPVSTRWIGVWL
jgi:chromosome segregation ATPase